MSILENLPEYLKTEVNVDIPVRDTGDHGKQPNELIKKHTEEVHAAEGISRMSKYFRVFIMMGSIFGA